MRPRRKTTGSLPQKRKDEKQGDQDFPGYPKYDPSEDITQNSTPIDVNLDDDELTRLKNNKEAKELTKESPSEEAEEPVIPGENDLTQEDLEALGPKDLSLDMGDDEQLKHRSFPVDFAGDDLDVPGSELDDEQEKTGSEDEENNAYSAGENE